MSQEQTNIVLGGRGLQQGVMVANAKKAMVFHSVLKMSQGLLASIVALLNLIFNYSSNYSTGELLKIQNFLISLIPGARLGWVLGIWTPLPFSAKERICHFCSALFIPIH